jgi:uncharacterized small protein (DUF1192 family)
MTEDEDRPKPPARFQPAALDGWAEADLHAYIAALRREILRAEAAIAERAAQRAAAEAFFRKA